MMKQNMILVCLMGISAGLLESISAMEFVAAPVDEAFAATGNAVRGAVATAQLRPYRAGYGYGGNYENQREMDEELRESRERREQRQSQRRGQASMMGTEQEQNYKMTNPTSK